MMLEEYCSYILSRNKDLQEFTIPGSSVKIDKSEFLSAMRSALRDNGNKNYDSLLVNTLLYYVRKEHLGKNYKFDKNMDSIMSNTRERVMQINDLYKSSVRYVPFSYERVFEILVYYLRIVTNSLNCDKEQNVHYVTAEIPPEAVVYILNRRLTFELFVSTWEQKRWKAVYKDVKLSYSAEVDNYLKFILLATYIRYCEIMGI